MRPVSHAAFLLLLTAFTASAQCYTFSGPGVKLSINIVIINQTFGPVVTQAGAATTYAFSGLNTFTLGGVTQTSADVLDGAANIQYLAGIPNVPGDTGVTSFVISVPNSDTSTKGNHFWTADLAGVGNLIPSYTLPQSLPGILAWQGVSNTNQISVTHGGAPINYPITAIGTCGSNTGIDGKLLGDTSNDPGDCHCNDPIDLRSGNLFQQFLDYRTSGPNPLSLIRYYNSMSSSSTLAGTLGPGWRTNYDRYLRLSPNSVAAERADGKEYTFTLNNGNWTMDTDADVKLSNAGSTWTFTDRDDTVETYAALGGTKAQLQSIRARNGYTQTLAYDANNVLLTVTDSYQRQLTFSYTAGFLSSVATPDGLTISYGIIGNLRVVSFSGTQPSEQQYVYENSALPNAMTGYFDENGARFATWTYDSSGRVITEQLGAGAGLATYTYNDTDGSRTVSNALGETELFKFTTLQGVPKLTEIDRSATSSTPAGVRLFTFDSNGYPASSTDWNGNLTTYVNDARGQPISVTEASGTPLARTASISYHQAFHLPTQIAVPGLTTTFTYDSNGEVLTSTQTDTATNASPRIWTYTWANSLPASVKGPRPDVSQLTKYTYDSAGALTAITDALGHMVQVTQHLPGGFPQTIIDGNGITRKLAYDTRQRLISRTVVTAAGPLTTKFSYDNVGNRTGTTLPDGSGVTKTYDAAHRLAGQSDVLGDSIAYSLDALGDRTQISILDSNSALQLQRGGAYDALGRIQQAIGGANQATVFTYDANSNIIGITNPLSRTIEQSFDALNRVISRTDPAKGKVTTAYDANGRPLVVTDARGAVTSFTYDGFGDAIQYAGARGNVSAKYDAAGNLIQKTDGRGVVANYTYDALNRLTSISYPGNSAENVTYIYDEAGHGFGAGRMTSVTDAAGTLSRIYDERGNLLSETRTLGSATLVTAYTYTSASNLSSITYPSKWTVNYTRDKQGRITAASATAPGGGAPKSVVANATYAPFGPLTGLSYGNGLSESRAFDRDYRATRISVNGNSPVLILNYDYDAGNNVLSIGDGVAAANSQNFSYDPLNRILSAAGAYGSLTYSYDANGNRLTEGAATPAVDGLGSDSLFVYNQSGRLASVSANGQQLTQYTYDAFGERLAKTGLAGASTLYQYDSSGHLLEEADRQGNFLVDYIYLDDRPVAAIQASTNSIAFLHTDSLGTPQIATDGSQAIVWAGGSQPFGAIKSLPTTLVQNLRLPGQEFDQETGLYFNGFRPYVPGWGRYLQSDPTGLGGGLNTYAYAAGNPLMFSDPLGLGIASETWEFLKGEIQDQLWEYGLDQKAKNLEEEYGPAVDYSINVIVSIGSKLVDFGKVAIAGGEILCPVCDITIGVFIGVLPEFALDATAPHEDLTGIGQNIDQLNAYQQAATSCSKSNPQGQIPGFTPPPPGTAPNPQNPVFRAF
jgi:RHS repeat-associated protein